MKFLWKVGSGPVNKRLKLGGDPDHRLDTRIVFRIRHCWIYGNFRKWLTDINMMLILIRQMAALVIRALAEVCTALSQCF